MISSPIFKNKDYSLIIKHNKSSAYITMQMFSSVVNTADLPNTHSLLTQILPSIHSGLCFNNLRLPFAEEAKNTETGHLFEHILIEYLYLFTRLKTKKEILVKGETSWDWYKEKHGTFNITLNAKNIDREIFFIALEKSTDLLNKILS